MDRRAAMIVLALATPVAMASAQPRCGAGTSLSSPTCRGWAGLAELEEALSTELGSSSTPGARVNVDPVVCEPGATHFAIEVEVAGRTTRRTVDLADAPSAGRPRILALLISEMVRAACAPPPAASASSDVASNVPPASPPAPSPVASVTASPFPALGTSPKPTAMPPSSTASALVIGPSAVLDARAFPAFTAALVGGRAGVDVAYHRLGGSLDAVVVHGSTRDPLGSVGLTSYGVGVTVGALGGDGTRHRFGVRTDFLWTTASGESTRSDVITSEAGRMVITTAAEARIDLPLGDDVRGTFSLLAGGVLRGLYARSDERTAAGVAGPMMGIAVGGALKTF